MKKVIRNGVFETNSSSCHSLVISEKNSKTNYDYSSFVQSDGFIHTTGGEFGWSGECDSFQDKLSYIITMIWETEVPWDCHWNTPWEEQLENLMDTDGFDLLNQTVESNISGCQGVEVEYCDGYYPMGYIDHQSTAGYHSLQDFLDDYGVTLEQFLFDDNVYMDIDHDNH